MVLERFTPPAVPIQFLSPQARLLAPMICAFIDVAAPRLEAAVLDALARRIMTPDPVEVFVNAYRAEWARPVAERSAGLEAERAALMAGIEADRAVIPQLHPSLAEAYRAHAARLRDRLRDPDATEALHAARALSIGSS